MSLEQVIVQETRVRYRSLWNYKSSLAVFLKDRWVFLEPAVAEQINRDSPGVLVLADEQPPAAYEATVFVHRCHRGDEGDQGVMSTATMFGQGG